MNFFKKLFGSKTSADPIAPSSPASTPPRDKSGRNYAEFWAWFATQAPRFFQVVKNKGDFERDFFAHLSPRLKALHEGFWMLSGMAGDDTAELVITAEGQVANFVFVEELIAAAPPIAGWKFTALKPAIDMGKFGVEMNGVKFGIDTISFYPIEDARYPDEIIIGLIHQDYTPQNHDMIGHGCMIFIDNYLGELNAALMVDQFKIMGRDEVQGDLVPMEKLVAYLQWRQAEFVEKYDGERRDTEHVGYSVLNGQLQSGFNLVAVINTDLLRWDRKASHPWMLVVELGYDGLENNGMPNEEASENMLQIEDAILAELRDVDGYLNIGRQTAQNERAIFFACREFRKPAKVLDAITRNHVGSLRLNFEIFKDPYWRSVGHLMPRD